MTSTKQFELAPIGTAAKWFFALAALLPNVIVGIIWWLNPEEFAKLPVWFLPLILGIGPALLLFGAWGARNPVATLGPSGLQLKVSFIRQTWSLAEINRDDAMKINLENRKELRPKWKLWGAAMPGLSSGLFKLHNGDKAHVYLTDKTKVVYLQTQKGVVLLSLERPGDFLDYLKGL